MKNRLIFEKILAAAVSAALVFAPVGVQAAPSSSGRTTDSADTGTSSSGKSSDSKKSGSDSDAADNDTSESGKSSDSKKSGSDSDAADTGDEATEDVVSSSESVSSSSEAEEKFDYESALSELDDLNTKLNDSNDRLSPILDKIRALDDQKNDLLRPLSEDDRNKVVTMAATRSGEKKLKTVQENYDDTEKAYEEALKKKEETSDRLHSGDVTVKKIHDYRDAVVSAVKLQKQKIFLGADLETLTDEQQTLQEHMDSLLSSDASSDESVTGKGGADEDEEGADADSTSTDGRDKESGKTDSPDSKSADGSAERSADENGADADSTDEDSSEDRKPLTADELEETSLKYLHLTESQNDWISKAVKEQKKKNSIQTKRDAKADEIKDALDSETADFEQEKKDFEEEEADYQKKLKEAEEGQTVTGSQSSDAGTSDGASSGSSSSGSASGTSQNSASTGSTSAGSSAGDETVITKDNNGNIRTIIIHPDGTTSIDDSDSDTDGLSETTSSGTIQNAAANTAGHSTQSTQNTADSGNAAADASADAGASSSAADTSASGDTAATDTSGTDASGTDASGTASEGTAVTGQDIVNYALQFVGNPYVWGGTSLTNGCDCSGFVQQVFAHFGIKLTRTTYTQCKEGKEISYADIQPGDVIYYSGHTAIYIGNNQIVHAANSRVGIIVSNDPTYMTIQTVRRFY